ncbi:MAG TPA: DUF6600 domain-containing protein [Pyrinomonadaceae bacterium]|nr:DUF6600 domain-containing protein [Pyrinomonadaceae bacterium]
MNKLKVWPHLTVVFVIFAALGMAAAYFWMREEPKTQAFTVPSAARVERVDGEVGINRNLTADASQEQWVEVTPNTPLTTGDRLYAREDARAGIAFTGRNFARLEPNSALDVLSLSDGRTQLALREGSAIFNIGELAPEEMFEVATPHGAVDFQQPGLYEMGYNDDGSTFVSVLSGLAQVVGLAGSGEISKGEMLTLLGQTAAQVVLSRLSPEYAGGLLDDYYGYQYPDLYDGRYNDYDAYLQDPYYYDPYNRYASYRYVPADVPGVYDLDAYGDWANVDGYGYAWSPRVEDGWAPYRQGYWTMDDPYGLTWVSSEPWGYAPYHYGRWVNANNRWYWIPDGAGTQPVYSPALVAFVPLADENQIAWVPLAPGDAYAPVYYDANWQPHYPDGRQVVAERVINFGVPGAVTVVSADAFDRRIDRGALARFDPRTFEGKRPVLDPLSHAMLRQAALGTAVARRGFVLPPGLAKRLDDRQVFTSARPDAPPFRDDRARGMRAEVVPDKQKKEKLRVKDDRQAVDAQAPGAPRGVAEDGRLAREARQREKTLERAARRQQLSRPQGSPARAEAERARASEQQRARGERVGHARQADREAARQQENVIRQQQRVAAQQQGEARRREAEHRAAARRAQQQQVQRVRAPQPRVNVERQHPRPRPAAQASSGQVRKQQTHAQQGRGRAQGPPQAAKPQGQGQGRGGKKGRP